jgi:cytochrome c556
MLAAIFEPSPAPGTPYTDAEEIFNALTGEDGLGALEITQPTNAPGRYYLSIRQTLRMYFTASLALVDPPSCGKLVWEQTQKLARRGIFDEIRFIDAPSATGYIDLPRTFDGVDSAVTRLVVLDSRRWTLLNGKDTLSRAEITALLGLGPDALRVDNAASCVVACVNTQRRDVARKRAREVLAWRSVLKQINPEDVDEFREATTKVTEAEDKLKKDIEKAFQHYAYLVRASDGLHVEFKRFDDDSKSSLRGDQVWAALIEAGRATDTAGLSADYLAALLDAFERTLTPREVVQSFYKNPMFPLVATTDEIRQAIFALLRNGWELADSDGNKLAIASPEHISIGSISQNLRRAAKVAETVPAAGGASKSTTTISIPRQPGGPVSDGESSRLFGVDDQEYRATTGQASEASPGDAAPSNSELTSFKRYIIDLTNRSITAPDSREQVWQLLKELSKVIDAPGTNHQLISLSVTLVTSEGAQGAIEQKAQQAGARVRVEDDDF